MPNAHDSFYMQLALDQARQAAAAGEVPVGAVVVCDGRVLGLGHNAPIGTHDPSAHAEVAALRAAALALGNYRLSQCEVFVTLEPCAMCAGALLHARVKRVVFGAPDPKAGAGGSVLNLFENSKLNHHTQLEGGVMAEPCAQLLGQFFKNRRQENATRAKARWPLREDALRTPDTAFESFTDFAFTPHYVADLPSLSGLRQHYIDEGPADAPVQYLALHEPGTWAYAFRTFIHQALQDGARVVVPDMVGFGKSDKPKKASFHSTHWHRQNLLELLERLKLQNLSWVVQGEHPWGLASPDCLRDLPVASSALVRWHELAALPLVGLGPPTAVATNNAVCPWQAPFPNAGYRAGFTAFQSAQHEGVEPSGHGLQ